MTLMTLDQTLNPMMKMAFQTLRRYRRTCSCFANSRLAGSVLLQYVNWIMAFIQAEVYNEIRYCLSPPSTPEVSRRTILHMVIAIRFSCRGAFD